MYPEQPQPQPEQQPPYQPPVAEQAPVTAPRKSLKLPIILMVWPAASIVFAIILYVIVNAVIQDPSAGSDLFGDQNPVKATVNIITFIIGGAAVILGPISFIIGLVLLIQRKTKR